jgi:hypothetical protein
LVNAVSALAKSYPALIVVDLDTSSRKSFPEGYQLPKIDIPVIWAVDADWEPSERDLTLKPSRVIGGRLADLPAIGIHVCPQVWTAQSAGGRSILWWTATMSGLYLKLRSRSTVRREVAVLPCPRNLLWPGLPVRKNEPALREFTTEIAPDPRLRQKIVVLGAFHSYADRHDTP